ncbi:hypothetical protein BDV95DRAFT_613266 [Massariosphaeria phaeospora]|uniref:Uncharacterized protein n=1 Tax=Massariosphaeria phaeospora TaxID=100035 RepID=A0A7C8I5B4_9PLEO|nr:hypothetical protein BDV95DRAFT_613266 [Massariosphaeria phaeospora]
MSSDSVPAGTTTRPDIIVVGASRQDTEQHLGRDSLGGVCTALALKAPPYKHRIPILERNPSPLLHSQGAGIVAGGDTLSVFKRDDRCGRQLAVSSSRRQYISKAGDVVHTDKPWCRT